MDFELRHLRYALAVADHRSFRRAAQALHVHQSAISRRVRDLEDRVGISLFERGRGGVRPTAAGDILLRDVRGSIGLLDRTMERAGALGCAEQGRLSIGYAGSLVSTQMLRLLSALREQIGDIDIHLSEEITTSLIQGLFDGRLDVAVLRTMVQPPGLETLLLWQEDLVLAAPKNHRVSKLRSANAQHLKGERLFIPHSNDWNDAHRALQRGLGPDVRMAFHECHREATLMLVAAEMGLAVVGSSAATLPISNVVFVPLEVSLPLLDITAVWPPGVDNPALRRFLSVLRQHQESARSRIHPLTAVD